MKHLTRLCGLAVATMVLGASMNVNAQKNQTRTYEVTVTNLTKGQSFTPILGATHARSVSAFTVGEQASDELAVLAESGGIDPLKNALESNPKVADTAASEGLLTPGQSTTLTIETKRGLNRLTVAAMLIPTNDAFMAINSVKLPRFKGATYYATAYDAGSETNDENCQFIPGPVCGGEGVSENDTGEGYIYPSPGISGEADLSSLQYNWQGRVAKIEVKRVY